jgi:hypothetical protein
MRFMESLLSLARMHWDLEPAISSAEHRLGAYRRDDGLAPRRCSALQFMESGSATAQLCH